MPRALTLRSARCQSVHWHDGELRIVNYLTRETFAAQPILLEVLRFFFSPKTIVQAMLEFQAYTTQSVGEVILELIKAGLLLERDSPEAARDGLLDASWKHWLPVGGYHFLTKDAPYLKGDLTVAEESRAIPRTPQPAKFKSIEGAERIALAPPDGRTDSFFQTLHARRTRRAFSRAPASVAAVSKLLQTTWGVQGFMDSKYFGALPLKTSPSGGARHPIEVYLMALRVQGLDAGLYHYDARAHALERIASGASAQQARAYCADQPYAARAAALFIMTAIFARTMWKYPHPRAYRVVLLDAGHLGQTFCLTATRMGLAPFSTAALKDTLIERDLGIDGISESVIYVTGFGMPVEHSGGAKNHPRGARRRVRRRAPPAR